VDCALRSVGDVLLADRFVYIHEPKTGGTFVTYALTQLHGGVTAVRPSRFLGETTRLRFPTACYRFERRRALRSATSHGRGKYGPLYSWNDHGTCSEIPRMFRSRQLLATVRNPFQTYVSGYLFGWWKRPEYLSLYRRTIRDFPERYSSFPDLSFREYMELMHASWTAPGNRDLYSGKGVGFQSERFIRLYFRVPWLLRGTKHDISSVVRRVDSRYVRSRGYVADMYDVRFLRTERLNEELREVLLAMGYEAADVEFVETLKHVVPAGGAEIGFTERATSHDWAAFYTPDLREIVRKKDDLLFSLFPEFDATATAASP
jgi:hypothetical protein